MATFRCCWPGIEPDSAYDPQNNFAPYATTQGVPVCESGGQVPVANPKLYPLPNATPTDGIAANNYKGPTAQL